MKSTIELVNSQGGVLGRPLELIQGNDESDATKTPAVLAQLKDKGAIFLLSQQGVPTPNTLIESTGLPFMTVTSVSSANGIRRTTRTDSPSPPARAVGADVLQVVQGRRREDVAILAEDSATIKYLNGVLLEAWGLRRDRRPGDGADRLVGPDGPDHRIKDQNADAVWVTSSGGRSRCWRSTPWPRSCRTRSGTRWRASPTSPSWPLANAGAMEGLVGLGSLSDDNVQTQKLREILKEDRGDDFVATAFDAQAYDAVMIIKRALETTKGDTSPMAIVEALESMSSTRPASERRATS